MNGNIYQKINYVTEKIGKVQKNLSVQVSKTNSYKAVSESDVIDAVKPLELEAGICSFPVRRVIVESQAITQKSVYNGIETEKTSFHMRVETTYRFVNTDNPEEYIDIVSYGDGLDTGDKSPGKAMTYADKYALMKMYKISTGDDPDGVDTDTAEGKKDDESEIEAKKQNLNSKILVIMGVHKKSEASVKKTLCTRAGVTMPQTAKDYDKLIDAANKLLNDAAK